jgi:NAD+ synthase (glutamine-hydrolysing)
MALSTLRVVMSDSVVRVATCVLNQWAMNFSGNVARILRAILEAKSVGANLLLTPELSICGYGCEDHFLESETFYNCVLSLVELLQNASSDIVFVVGMPWLFQGVRYNVNVFCLNSQILFIRPKMFMANDANYRELRWFTPWNSSHWILEAELPKELQIFGQKIVSFGHAILSFNGIKVGIEMCEELFTSSPPHVQLSFNGCDVILNSSGSHHELRKLNTRVELIQGAMHKCGGTYLYANQRGCDGGRLYFDGSAMICLNGDFVGQASQFGTNEIEITVASVDVDKVRSKRATMSSSSIQASKADLLPITKIDFSLIASPEHQRPTPKKNIFYNTPEQEISFGPACWMWDYLRRSNGGGFFLPLSGGADSAATAAMVGIMCQLVFSEIQKGNEEILFDLRRVVKTPDFMPTSHQQIANRILHTCYMGTANSSDATRARAAALAEQIGAFHKEAPIDTMVMAGLHVVGSFVSGGVMPRFASAGGSATEDLALQNLQARNRMVLAYLMAQLLPGQRKATEGTGDGFLLVLGSANVDESLRGYMTKYDCSSADLNPIGGISKTDLKTFLLYAADAFSYPALKGIVLAPPTAELRPMEHSEPQFGKSSSWTCSKTLAVLDKPLAPAPPIVENLSGGGGVEEHSQLDEADMGMSYAELSVFGKFRMIERCGPFDMYKALLNADGVWATLTPEQIATKVKRFFFFYGINRHKMTTLTPSYHAEAYGPDDNRFDHRQFLYPGWESCRRIDAHVKSLMPE